MNKALLAALASVALLGASCSVQDFSTVVMDKPTITADIDATSYGYGAPTSSGLMALENGDVITALRVGNPQSQYFSTGWGTIFYLTDGNYQFQFVTPSTSTAFYNRVTLADTYNTLFTTYLSQPTFGELVNHEGSLVFGGSDTFVTGETTNRDVTLYFNTPLRVGGINTAIPVGYFASTIALRDYNDGHTQGYYDAERDNGIFNHAFSITASDGSTTATNYIDNSLLEWYASANTQGLFDPYGLVSFFGLSTSATSYSFTIQYGEFAPGANFPLAAYPLYVDVLSDGVVEDASLCPSLTISTYRGGSIRGFTLFDTDFTRTYAGLAIGYPNADIYNPEYDTFNRISLYLPKNQSYSDMRQIGVVSPYAQGFVDGVTSRDGEVSDLTDRIRNLEVDLSQYQGKTYEQIYNLGLQAGLDENAQGAATFNSLFGNILTAPLTILNGLTDISFFGMPILTAILSLLMVAMALFLFKRFK